MRTLIVGIGALGGVIGARLQAAGGSVSLATRTAVSAAHLRVLHVTGIGGDVSVLPTDVRALDDFTPSDAFELIVLATKAREAIAIAPRLRALLAPGGALVPIQNGAVSQLLAAPQVVGGLSNLGATMTSPGHYAQRNAGHLLIAADPRAERIRAWLGQAIEVRIAANFAGAVWAKLLLNCSTTTLGAVAGQTMREYIGTPAGRALFDLTYDEALAVARASGVEPARMLVEPIPPASPADREEWLGTVLASYGDLKASMLQDFERGIPTEIDFINGYVADRGRALGVPTPANAAVTKTVEAITRGELAPDPTLLVSIASRFRADAAAGSASPPAP